MLYNHPLALLMLGSSMAMGMAPELHPYIRGGSEKIQITTFTMPNNFFSMKYALNLKSTLGFADVGVPNGHEDGPGAPPRCHRGSEKISNN